MNMRYFMTTFVMEIKHFVLVIINISIHIVMLYWGIIEEKNHANIDISIYTYYLPTY